MSVGQQLRTRRVDDGLSQRALAARLSLAEEVIRKVELDDGHQPIPRNKKLIADYLDHKVSDLWPIAEHTNQETPA